MNTNKGFSLDLYLPCKLNPSIKTCDFQKTCTGMLLVTREYLVTKAIAVLELNNDKKMNKKDIW